MSRSLILMYHSIDLPRSSAEARYCVTPSAFRAQMAALVQTGFNPIALDTLVNCLRTNSPVPPGSVAVTFDDGFRCFQLNALPVLQEFCIPATLFAVAGKIGGTNTWMQAKGWPERELMQADELRAIESAGVTIGCHGMSHRPMTQISDADLVDETVGARKILRDILGSDVSLFAYPHGAQGARERQAVSAAGFAAACSTEPGFNRRDADLYALRRLDVYGGDSLNSFRRKIRFGANEVTYGDLTRYYASRIYSRLHG